jgi:GAF domain-containing protein
MAAHAQDAVVVANLDDPRLTDEERRDMGEYGFESELCIPLVVDERVIGLIDVFDTRPRDYREYLDFLKSVGQIVAGALGRAVPASSAEIAANPPT